MSDNDKTQEILNFLKLNPDIEHALNVYKKELLKWNKKINLISKKETEKDILYHFYDSICFSLFLPDNTDLLDVGTGGGFPGLVTAVCKPDADIFLMEPNSKKTAFLTHIKNKLNLSNVTILNERLTIDYSSNHWYNAVCRAFTDLEEWQNLANSAADNLWFLASEKQSIHPDWFKLGYWKSEKHGKRYILKLKENI